MLGKYSLDAETGQVGPEIAELLGIAQITGVRKVQLEGSTIAAERESDEGYDEVECAMPAVLTCAERVAQPIRVKPEAAEQASARPIETVRAAALDSDPAQFGAAGSPTWVQEVRAVQSRHPQVPHDRRWRPRARGARSDRGAKRDGRAQARGQGAPPGQRDDTQAGARA